ncbi:MAG: leucine--tRNA ligase [Schleiferiaceae bacterium]|nr:leucine--tRNA ligase [Schleiferiaceae bacterium]
MEYRPGDIEPKWQAHWRKKETFRAEEKPDVDKYYVLDMFPYPSGAGLHVGHPLGYIASDIVARYHRHLGYQVLHPMGYDSFGLPAEQYAIQTGQHPAKTTEANIARYRQQLDQMGFSFDWSREVRTSDPNFYRWTQWIFLQLFESWYNCAHHRAESISTLLTHFRRHGSDGLQAFPTFEGQFTPQEWAAASPAEKEEILQHFRLAYRSESTVNWCPALGTVLANDEVKEGYSERGGHPVIQKKMMQWSLRVTAYADRLEAGLNTIDWPASIVEAQRNWIGRSEGARVYFDLPGREEKIEVFTTRPDTLFGVTFMVLAPEHPLVDQLTTAEYATTVKDYQEMAARRSERERMAEVKKVTGAFTGAYARHPFKDELLPIWIADYVLASYGTGAVMAVPAHDSRDWTFAKTFDLPLRQVVAGGDIEKAAHDAQEGKLEQSDFLNGLPVSQAIPKAIEALEAKGAGRGEVNYRLRDAIFGRQRYWGEPIPIYYDDGVPHPVRETHLPLELPDVDQYLPTETGEPPLARAERWHYHPDKGVVPPGEGYPLELTTMPGWAGSSWYDLRYMDPHNRTEPVGRGAQQYWQQVDLYLGGSEHATGHLIYTRFWHKFLKDRGYIEAEEPFKKLINQGMILGNSALVYRRKGENVLVSAGQVEDPQQYDRIHADVSLVNTSDELDVAAFRRWRDDLAGAEIIAEKDGSFKVLREVEKMSKSKYNVVNPDDIIAQYGADTLRMYEMFLGPLEQSKPWNTAGISGVHNFLRKTWRLFWREDTWLVTEEKPSEKELKSLHQLIKKVTQDLKQYSFNTAVSAFMIAVKELSDLKCHKRAILEPLLVTLSPFAPHLSEELWEQLGYSGSIERVPFPAYEESYLQESTHAYPISFNGKVRFTHELDLSLDKKAVEEAVLGLEKTQKYLGDKPVRKVIVVPGKIVNIVQ